MAGPHGRSGAAVATNEYRILVVDLRKRADLRGRFRTSLWVMGFDGNSTPVAERRLEEAGKVSPKEPPHGRLQLPSRMRRDLQGGAVQRGAEGMEAA